VSGQGNCIVDLRPLVNAHSRRGIGRYVAGLLRPDALDSAVLMLTERRRWGPITVRQRLRGIEVTLPPRPVMRLDPVGAVLARRRIERLGAQLIHLTDPYLLPWAPRSGRLLVTVYDLIMYGGPDRLSRSFTLGLEAALGRGAHVVAISEATAQQLTSRLGVPGSRVHVLLPGPTSWLDAGFVEARPDAVVVGALDVHKQPLHARQAAELAGVPITFAGRHQPELARRWGIAAEQLLSGPTDYELARTIQGARCLVHASREEGFGLPVLEALVMGTPVAAYDLPVTREIVGPNYPLVPLSDGPAGLAGIIRMCSDDTTRAQLVALAQPNLHRFDWERSRQQLYALYRTLV